MYKNYLYSDENGGRSTWALLFHQSRCCWSVAIFYALTKAANSAGRQKETHMLAFTLHRNISKERLNLPCVRVRTVSANLAVTVGVAGLEESRGLGIGQCACTGLEVLQEQPADRRGRWLVHRPQLPLANPHFMFNMDIRLLQHKSILMHVLSAKTKQMYCFD